MKIDQEQFDHLMQLVHRVDPRDTIGCDGCAEPMDRFAKAELDGKDLDATMQAVKLHIEQCRCCRDEYQALLTALREIGS